MNSELMSHIVITVKKQYLTRNHHSDEQWTHVSYCNFNFRIVISYCIVAFNKNPPIHYLNKLEYFIRPIKKNIFSELLAFWKVC